ncbi:LysR substrate-binding domain-containing protein [Arthrobacter tecti]
MNLTHLRAFHLVARHGGFAAGARAAGVSQPTLSEQVGLLEKRYAAKLFVRSGRSIELTALGSNLASITERLFAGEMEAEALLSRSQGRTRGELRLGTAAPIHAVKLLTAFRDSQPNVAVQLISGNSHEIREKVIAGVVDVGIIADQTPHPDLRGRALATQDLVAFVRSDNVLGAQKAVSLRELVQQPLIIREVGSVTRSGIERALADIGIRPDELLEADSREAVHAAVMAGLGIGVVAEDEFADDPRLVMLDFSDPVAPITEYLVYRKERHGDHLIQTVLQCLPEP